MSERQPCARFMHSHAYFLTVRSTLSALVCSLFHCSGRKSDRRVCAPFMMTRLPRQGAQSCQFGVLQWPVLHTRGIAISLAVEDLSILTKGRLVRWRVHPAVVGVRLIRLLQRALEADDLARRLVMLGAATASVRRRRELRPLVMCFEMRARHEQACDSVADRRAELFGRSRAHVQLDLRERHGSDYRQPRNRCADAFLAAGPAAVARFRAGGRPGLGVGAEVGEPVPVEVGAPQLRAGAPAGAMAWRRPTRQKLSSGCS